MQEALSTGKVNLNGVRTIRSAEETRSLLIEALAGASPLSLDCSLVTDADLSLVQLLLSARKTAQRAGKILTLAAPADEVLQQALSRAGFETSPDPLTGNQSQWLKKEGEDA